jgi:hypothetical protein
VKCASSRVIVISHRTLVEPVRRGPWPGGKGIKPGVGSRTAKCVPLSHATIAMPQTLCTTERRA